MRPRQFVCNLIDKRDTTIIKNHMEIKRTASNHTKITEEPASSKIKVQQKSVGLSLNPNILSSLKLHF